MLPVVLRTGHAGGSEPLHYHNTTLSSAVGTRVPNLTCQPWADDEAAPDENVALHSSRHLWPVGS